MNSNYDSKRYADFYETSKSAGSGNLHLETQYGMKDGKIIFPTAFFTNFYKQLKFISKVVDKLGAKVLDVGCGDGVLCGQLKEISKYTGVDISSTRIRYCKDKYRGSKYDFYTGDILEINLADKFDIIVCSEIVEHMPDVDLFFKKIFDLLKPGGTVVLSTPLCSKYLDFSDKIYEEQHLRCYDLKTIKNQVEGFGFKIIKIRAVGFQVRIKLNGLNKKIFRLFKKGDFQDKNYFEFSLQNSSYLNRLYFQLGRFSFAWIMLFDLINCISFFAPAKGNQILIVAKKV